MTGEETKMNIHKDKMLWYNTSYCINIEYKRNGEQNMFDRQSLHVAMLTWGGASSA